MQAIRLRTSPASMARAAPAVSGCRETFARSSAPKISLVSSPSQGLRITRCSGSRLRTGARSVPIPGARWQPPAMQKGTAAPRRAPSACRRSGGYCRSQSAFRPTRAAAASPLPPPRPAATGTCFSKAIFARGAMPASSASKRAARKIRFCGSGRRAPSIVSSRSSASRRRSVSHRLTDCMSRSTSWYPSARRRSTSTVRLTLARACKQYSLTMPSPKRSLLGKA